jgi:hypothetical protein
MVAVGGLLPLPVILLFGIGSGPARGIVLLITLVHLVVYAWIFHRIASGVGALVRTGRVPVSVAVLVVVATLVGLTFVPIYGSGENLAGGGKLRQNAYEVYREALDGMVRAGRR